MLILLKVQIKDNTEYLEFSNEKELKKYTDKYIDFITFKNNVNIK